MPARSTPKPMAKNKKHPGIANAHIHAKEENTVQNEDPGLLKDETGGPSSLLLSSPPDPAHTLAYKPRSYVPGVTIHHQRPATIKSGNYSKAEMIRVLKISDEIYREFQELIAFLITHHMTLDSLNLKDKESRNDYCDIINLFLGFLGDDCTNALQAHVEGSELSWILFQLTLKIKAEVKLIVAKEREWKADVPYTIAKAISMGKMPHPVAFNMVDLEKTVKSYEKNNKDDLCQSIFGDGTLPEVFKSEENGEQGFGKAVIIRYSDDAYPEDIDDLFEHANDGFIDPTMHQDGNWGETSVSESPDPYESDGHEYDEHQRARGSLVPVIVSTLILFWCAIYFLYQERATELK
ncbi:hypothetical protein AA313_de0208086 [Arthrobotrys entomopaga]|nr:hypothetical protein AA313_de0208086 [Arthrobotrys entomopaga]